MIRAAQSVELSLFMIHLILVALVSIVVAQAQAPPSASAATPRTYPDFALQAAPINASPGPEYGSSTRVYQGVPGIERTASGRMWAVWTGGGTAEGPLNYVLLVTSGDDGSSWSQPRLVIDPPGNVLAWDSFLWIDPLGRLWLFWTQAYGRWDGRGGVWTIVSDNPDMEQPTWSTPRRLSDGMVQNKPTVLSTGEWLLPVWFWPSPCDLATYNDRLQLGLTAEFVKSQCHDSGDPPGSMVYRSADQGKTWALLGAAQVQDAGIDEHMIVERRDGSLWMLVRTFYGIGQAVSTDRGKSWGQTGPSGIRHPWSRFFIRRLKSGRLMMVRHNPPSIGVRSHLTAYLSDDDGRSWLGGLLLDERSGVSYPDGVEAANGRIYVIYDHGRTTEAEILMATFGEEDIQQGACVTADCRLKLLVNKAGP